METVNILGQQVPVTVSSLKITRVESLLELSSAIGRLTNVEELKLTSSNIVGRIPTELGLLVKLTSLELSGTSVSGEIPTQLGSLDKLTALKLKQNGLATSLPSEFGQLVRLKVLEAQDNQLAGEIPSELGVLGELQTILLQNNFFEATLPSQLGQLAKLKRLYLFSSKLLGPIPSELGTATALVDLQLQFNDLSGELPSEIGNLVALSNVFVSFNKLGGKIPTELGNLRAIDELSLNDNQFVGPIPSELGNLELMNILDLQSNQLSGSLPSQLGRLTNLRFFLPQSNKLGSSIASEIWNMKELVWLELAANGFTATISPEISNLSHLSVLNLRSNLLRGEIPSQLGTLSKLTDLDLKAAGFEGRLPPELSRLENLVRIDLSENRFGHILPSEFGLLTSLKRMYASNSNFTGRIPTEVAGMQRLRALHLDHNRFTGTIPSTIGDLDLKLELRLDNNLLHGTVPTDIGKMSSLKTLALNDNALEGALPSELGNLGLLVEIFLARNQFSFVCNCELLSWYPDLIEQTVNQDANDVAPCANVNEYGGIYPHILRSESEAPCYYPIVNETYTEVLSSSIGVAWNFRAADVNALIAPRVDLANDYFSFRKCEGFVVNSAIHGSGFVALGFEIDWQESVRCVWAGEALVEGDTYRYSIDRLKPFVDYEFTVRAIHAYFGEHDSPVRYVYGSRSSRFQVRTGETSPRGSPVNISVSHRGPDEVELRWLDPSVANGIIVETQGEVYGADSEVRLHVFNTSLKSENLRGIFEPSLQYFVRLRARTRADGFGNWSEPVKVQTCPKNTRTIGNDDRCEAEVGFFLNKDRVAVSCEVLPLWSIVDPLCSEGALNVSNLNLSTGVWRESLESTKLARCPNPSYCRPGHKNGTVQHPNDYCSLNHQGIYCEGCVNGYTVGPLGCIACSERGEQLAAFMLGLMTLVFLGFMFICLVFSSAINVRIREVAKLDADVDDGVKPESDAGPEATKWWHINYEALKTKLRIFTGFLQIVFAYETLLGTETVLIPGVFGFLASLNVKQLSSTIGAYCWIPFKDHYWHLYAYTLTPILIVLLFLVISRVASKVCSLLKGVIEYEFTSATLFILFLVYPGVSQTIFETFWCEEFLEADGELVYKRALAADYTTSCEDSNERFAAQLVAGLMVLVYPIGVVALYVYFLRRYKVTLKSRPTDEVQAEKRKIKFLLYPYNRDSYWFEAYELVRKIVQTSMLGFIRYYGSDEIVFLSMLAQNVNVVAIVFLVYHRPYERGTDFAYAVISLFLVIPVVQLALGNALEPQEQTVQVGISAVVYLDLALIFGITACELAYAFYKHKPQV